MAQLNHDEIVALLLTLGTLLAVARLGGELASRLRQPAVVGELLAGILLGPTLLGRLSPELFGYLFPAQGPVSIALSGLTNLALVLFLLVAGMEVDLSAALRQGRAAVALGVAGIVVPFALGFVAGSYQPSLFGMEPGAAPLPFALFLATALSISALPVIARTLMDLHILRSDLGVIVMAAAIFNDLLGWIIFAVILGMIGQGGGSTWTTIVLTGGYWVLMLVVGRWAFSRVLPWLQAYASGAGGVLTMAASLAFFGAAFTEWVGVHAIFGSFMVGVALGDSPHLRQHVRRTLNDFVSFIFAPLFFTSIGLTADFAGEFDLGLVVAVTLIACLGKGLGCALGGRIGGLSRRETLAAAAGMNARGAMEIVLGLLALRFGLIGMRLFVALVVMALFTSVISGPLMQRILRAPKRMQVLQFLSPRHFAGQLAATERAEALRELCQHVAAAADLDAAVVTRAVLDREAMGSTALEQGVAAPHARLTGLTAPVVGCGQSARGIDFDAPDGRPVRLLFLLLTPAADDRAQIELLADIAQYCVEPGAVDQLVAAGSYTELRAQLMAASQERQHP